ncbi:uncharacterized protein E0L32_005804 [Thyridium curvatum]|uniref:Uncharacterized protein n=1 Tax=Thyridium curvatum TaxID=1093900 RepID=A0A507BB84_9PEZI|nr:uncharacterized protein E0L32_005804 [Thyridium curvatum]TPX13860.1 hypothetical protein E0L32_005804 [Thyridium curvatum]
MKPSFYSFLAVVTALPAYGGAARYRPRVLDWESTVGHDDHGLEARGPMPSTNSMTYATCTSHHSKLEDIPANVPAPCGPLYTLDTLASLLNHSLHTFETHVSPRLRAVATRLAQDHTNAAIRAFYTAHGPDYFTCVVLEAETCCGTCQRQFGAAAPDCRYCDAALCPGGLRYANVSEPCPPDYSLRGNHAGNYDWDTVYWTLSAGEKADAFYADLERATGVRRGETVVGALDHRPDKGGCRAGGGNEDCYTRGWDFGVPVLKGVGKREEEMVGDVVGRVEGVVSRARGMSATMTDSLSDLRAGGDGGEKDWLGEMVDAVSLPVKMVVRIIEFLEEVIQVLEQADHVDFEEAIRKLVTALMLQIPPHIKEELETIIAQIDKEEWLDIFDIINQIVTAILPALEEGLSLDTTPGSDGGFV